jgi:ATP-dependent DNA ligase
MSVLTKESGEGRKLICHPKQIIARKYLRRDKHGVLRVSDPDQLKIPDKSFPLILFSEPKLQGHRYIFSRDKDDVYHLHSRRLGIDNTYPDLIQDGRFPVVFDELGFPPLPRETAVDGELIWPGHPDSEVPTAIKECPHELLFKAFAVPIFESKYQFEKRYKPGRCLLRSFLPSKCVTRSGLKWEIQNREALKIAVEHLLYKAEQKGEEGAVLKEKHYQGWWKLKGISEADVFVTGHVVSKSETYAGQVTSLRIGVFDSNGKIKDMGKVSGFDDEEKYDLTEKYHAGVGYYRVLRVQYQEIAGKGKLKHAFFDCWRTDKNAEDCTTGQFEG